MPHIVLLGDSIFDNAVYSAPQPDVAAHLRAIVGYATPVTLLAVDGSITAEVSRQLRALPDGATDLVISSGGNDLLSCQGLLVLPARCLADALAAFDEPLERFAADYRALLNKATQTGPRVIVCTIHNGNLPPEEIATARTAVALFNDTIQRIANELAVAVIELRSICSDAADYANPIEPSGKGGEKIAHAIAATLARKQL